ncbi:MAG: hypothetical protein GY723_06070 [bacterium]|nr:hypothetical protein [bacterium]MCP5071201.1 hypothetical protein [bacterium]
MAGISMRILALVFLATHLLGCGYQLVRYADPVGDARRIALQPLLNDTFEPGIDSLLLDAFHREFLRRGGLRIVEDPETADLIVGGVIDSLLTRGRSFSSIQFALEYELLLRVDLEVTRPDGTPVPIDGRAFNESEIYLSSADLEVTRTNREEALRRLAGTMATRLHDALYERIQP